MKVKVRIETEVELASRDLYEDGTTAAQALDFELGQLGVTHDSLGGLDYTVEADAIDPDEARAEGWPEEQP